MLLLFALMVHLPGVMEGGERMQQSMPNFLKDLGLAAASMMYALNQARDNSIIG